MLDWLASKIGVLIAIGVLTTFVLGLFAWQHSAMADREGQAVADRIAGTLDSLAGLDAATLLNVTYGSGDDQLPKSIDRAEYTVNITSGSVTVTCGDRRWSSDLVAPVIPRNLTERDFNISEAENLNILDWSGEHSSGEGFSVERARIEVSGEVGYVTLVYWGG